MRIFHEPGDYDAFINVIGEAQDRCAVSIIGMCLMPNHLHMVIRPEDGASLSRWAQWHFTAHTVRYHVHHETGGHLWQGRYKIFPAQNDQHLLTVLRYVERNALRANLVSRAEDWRWSSLRWRESGASPLELAASPVALPRHWNEFVNEPQTAVELAALRECVNRQRPFGASDWAEAAAKQMGNEQSLRALGRPRKKKGSDPVS